MTSFSKNTHKVLWQALALLCMTLPFSAKAVTEDGFEGDSLNAQLWTASLPFPGSSVTVADGHLVLVKRGRINTLASFPDGLEISGRFRFTGVSDHFRVVFRSDLNDLGASKEKSGVLVNFEQAGGILIGESEVSSLGTVSYAFQKGTDIDFRITDDGATIKVFLGNVTSPIISAITPHRTGSRVAFYNRELNGTRVEIDSLAIRNTSLVDKFDDSQIKNSFWDVRTPFSDSGVTIMDGVAQLQNHGELLTKGEYYSPLQLTGRFRFSGNLHDAFYVTIRTTGESADIVHTYDNGIGLVIAKTDDTGARSNIFEVFQHHGPVLASTTLRKFSFSDNHVFKIIDTGTNIFFYIDNLLTPKLIVTNTAFAGNRIGFYNREGGGGGSSISAGSQVDLDSVEILSPPPLQLNAIPAIEVEFLTEAGKQYQIQVTEDFVNWTNWDSLISGTGTFFNKLYSTRTAEQLFYRVQEVH